MCLSQQQDTDWESGSGKKEKKEDSPTFLSVTRALIGKNLLALREQCRRRLLTVTVTTTSNLIKSVLLTNGTLSLKGSEEHSYHTGRKRLSALSANSILQTIFVLSQWKRLTICLYCTVLGQKRKEWDVSTEPCWLLKADRHFHSKRKRKRAREEEWNRMERIWEQSQAEKSDRWSTSSSAGLPHLTANTENRRKKTK